MANKISTKLDATHLPTQKQRPLKGSRADSQRMHHATPDYSSRNIRTSNQQSSHRAFRDPTRGVISHQDRDQHHRGERQHNDPNPWQNPRFRNPTNSGPANRNTPQQQRTTPIQEPQNTQHACCRKTALATFTLLGLGGAAFGIYTAIRNEPPDAPSLFGIGKNNTPDDNGSRPQPPTIIDTPPPTESPKESTGTEPPFQDNSESQTTTPTQDSSYTDSEFSHLIDQTKQWDTEGRSGLRLRIYNALSSDWEGAFDQAVSDWNNGNPDALSLTTRKIAEDSRCEPLDGTLKICNGNYGKTEWRGLNTLLVNENDWKIVASVSKLNEYYLGHEPEGQRQYTMCHEIGHGFGLPHLNEDYANEDLGDCMDYTRDPSFNKQPSRISFGLLADVYGVVNQPNRLRGLTNTDTTINGTTPQGILNQYREALDSLNDVTLLQLYNNSANRVDTDWKAKESSVWSVDIIYPLSEGYHIEAHAQLV